MKSLFMKYPHDASLVFRLFGMTTLLLVANLAFAQNFDANVKALGDLSTQTWKSTVDLNTVFSSEMGRTDITLATPDLQEADKALFLAYKRLVTYVQVDTQSGQGVDKAILESYKRVLTEALKEPTLQKLPTDMFLILVPGLVEVLTATPQVVPGQF